jgi:predicted permease
MARRRRDDDFAAEVQAHLALEADRLIDGGMAADEARAAALRAFGNPTRARETFHESSRWVWLEQAVQDVRYAWRGLRASPAFLATTVVTLAAGLSLLTVAFSVFNAYVLRPFAVADPGRLYRLAWRAPAAVGTAFSRASSDELRERTDLFDAVVGDDLRFVSSEGRTLLVSSVSGDYFSTLRPRMRTGRPLDAHDAGQPVAVISEVTAARLFDGASKALGRTLRLDTLEVTIVGVVSEEFGGLGNLPRDVWRPADPAGGRAAEIVVRLRDGVSPVQASLRLAPFVGRMAPKNTRPEDVHAVLVPSGTPNALTVELVEMLSPVFAAFALVLLAACLNASNMMLARAVSRHREIAVRLSLGASRSRIVRQLLTEGLLVAALAGGCALALAAGLLRAAVIVLFRTLPPFIASLLHVVPMPLDARVFLFVFGVALAATLLFALMPALQASRQPLTDALRGQRAGRPSAARSRNLLVVAQVAVSIVLVVTALVLARNFASLGRLVLGYATTDVYSINIRDTRNELVRPAADALARDARIAMVAVTSGNPLFATQTVPMAPDAGRAAVPVMYTFVSPEFLTLLRVPVVRGRAFRPDEASGAARVALVSQSTAQAFWPGRDPIGQSVRIERPPPPRNDEGIEGYSEVTVIGVVPDAVSGVMFEGADSGHLYLPATAGDPHMSALLVAPRLPRSFRPDMLRDAFRGLGVDPDLFETIALDEMRETQMYPLRAASWVGAALGGVALVLSIAGLYGVLVYTLAQRCREIGIRMALGATAAAVVGLVMRQSARMTAAGIVFGLGISFALLRVLDSVIALRAVSVLDPFAFGAAIVVVGLASLVAAYGPSRRAARVDPAETLRAEG